MRKSKFTEGQIVQALRQAGSGIAVIDVCRQIGVSEATFYVWKKRFAHLGVSELRRRRRLEKKRWLTRLIAISRSASTCSRRRFAELASRPGAGPCLGAFTAG